MVSGHVLRAKALAVKELRRQALLKNLPGPRGGWSPQHPIRPVGPGMGYCVVGPHCTFLRGRRCAEGSGCLWADERVGDQLCNLEELARQPCESSDRGYARALNGVAVPVVGSGAESSPHSYQAPGAIKGM